MNKKVLAVVVLLLIGLAGYFGYTKFMAGKTSDGSSETSNGTKSLKDLLSSGVAQKCAFSSSDESGSSEGVTYVSSGKVRGDFTTTSSGKETNSHMISDGKVSYIWTDGDVNGFKMTVEEPVNGNANSDSDDTSVSPQANLNEKVDYKCSGWVTDGSYFTPPTNVTFSDFSQILAPSSPSQGSGSGSSSQCSYCNALSGEDKTQCLTALKCN